MQGIEKRLGELLQNFKQLGNKRTIGDFANFIGTSRQSLGYYLKGERKPDADMVKQICERCNVSSDWLLGLSAVKKPNAELQAISDYTGLSPESLNTIRESHLVVLNCILSNEVTARLFKKMLLKIWEAYQEESLKDAIVGTIPDRVDEELSDGAEYNKIIAGRCVEMITDEILSIDYPFGEG
ncbi:MAG: helix-turn-helix domain-containing protein [Clostridiales bacterium]|nr:helix-turn-helix domain-containing protein [Clostridiales bacterium]